MTARGAAITNPGNRTTDAGRGGDERPRDLAEQTLDAARESIFRVQRDGRISYANAAACAALGYSRDELLALSIADIEVEIDGDTIEGLWETLAQAGHLEMTGRHRRKDGGEYSEEEMLGLTVADINPMVTADALEDQWRKLHRDGAIDHESRWHRKDGSTYPVYVSVSYVKHGREEFSFVSARDISAEKEAADKLAQTERRFALARQYAGMGVWEWDIRTGQSKWTSET